MTASNLTTLEAQRDQAQRELDAAQNHYRGRPRGGLMMGGPGAPVRFNPEARADMLDRGLAVDAAAIRLEHINLQLAEARLAELTDPATQAVLEAERDEAERVMVEKEAAASEARKALAQANGVLKDRQYEARRWQDEKARAEGTIRGAQAVQAKEQAQRDELAPLIPSSASGRVVARR